MSTKSTIFLGCSTEAADLIAPTIQEGLSKVALVKVWNQGVFTPGCYVPDKIITEANTVDFAVMLFAADDLLEVRGDRFCTARDNTVFESGLLMAILGRERTFFLVPDLTDMKIPTDLAGITTIRYPAKMDREKITWELEPVCRKISREIERVGPKQRLPELTGGMTAALGAFQRAEVVLHSQITELLAKYNRQIPSANVSGWEKAADYCIYHLESIGLLKRFHGLRISAKLTEKGERLLSSSEFKKHYNDTVKAKCAELPSILDSLFRAEADASGTKGDISRPNFGNSPGS